MPNFDYLKKREKRNLKLKALATSRKPDGSPRVDGLTLKRKQFLKATIDLDKVSKFSLTNRNFFDFGNTGMSKISITNASVGPDEENKGARTTKNKKEFSPRKDNKSVAN